MLVGPALVADALAGEVHDAIQALERLSVDVTGGDVPAHRAGLSVRPHDRDDHMAIRLQRDAQRRADEPR